MKNIVKIALICIVVLASLLIPNVSNAATANGCTLDLIYSSVVAGQPTIATSILKTDADFGGYTNVRVNIEVSGPADPTIYATDESSGQRIDVMKYKYWGPSEGFPIGANYDEDTDFEATFPVPGTYTIKLSLVDMKNSQAEIVSETYKINVGVRVTVVTGNDQGTFVTDGINSFDSLAIPEPKKDGYVFAGWYTDANFTTALDTTKDLTENTTVYAKFEAVNNQTGEEESNTTGENTVAEENEGEKDETPKTGVANYAGIAVLVIAISAATLFVIRKNRI